MSKKKLTEDACKLAEFLKSSPGFYPESWLISYFNGGIDVTSALIEMMDQEFLFYTKPEQVCYTVSIEGRKWLKDLEGKDGTEKA